MHFKDLYPTLSEDQLKEAEENLRRYFEIALDIAENNLKRATENRNSDGNAPRAEH